MDGSDCFSVGASHSGMHGGQVSCPRFTRLNRVPNSHVSPENPSIDNRPRIIYFNVKKEEEPFTDASLRNMDYSTWDEVMKIEIENTI